MNHVVTRRRGLVIVASLLAIGSTGCLPLPPSVKASICAAPGTYVPASISSAPTVEFGPRRQQIPQPNADLMARLLVWPVQLDINPLPVVTVRVPEGADAAEQAADLRREFGSAIDIEVGAKRLGGGVSGSSDACLLQAPTWAFAEALPAGVVVKTVPTSESFDRHGWVTATVFVTNRSRRTIRVGAHLQTRGTCGKTALAEVLSPTDSAIAVSVGKGVDPTDAPKDALSPLTGGLGVVNIRKDGVSVWGSQVCAGFLPSVAAPVPLRPGASTAFTVAAGTTSLQPGPDPVVSAGSYDLRSTFVIETGSGSSFRSTVVAAPPAKVTLHD